MVVLGVLLGLLVAAVLAVFVVAPIALAGGASGLFSGFYGNLMVGVTARKNAPAQIPVQQAGPGTQARGGGGQNVPPQFASRLQRSAADAYVGSCAECHGQKGDGKGPLGQTTVPAATDLTSHDARERSDSQLFWIIKNGLGFTAMPGYGGQYSDAEISGLVSYIRQIQNGQAQTISVPPPTPQQLAAANPSGDPAQRGAAVYFAQGCAECHGATGNAPGELALRESGETGAIRRGRPGMPAYSTDKVSNQQLSDLVAYMRSWPASARGQSRGEDD